MKRATTGSYVPRGKAARPEALKRYDGGPRVSLDDYLEQRPRPSLWRRLVMWWEASP